MILFFYVNDKNILKTYFFKASTAYVEKIQVKGMFVTEKDLNTLLCNLEKHFFSKVL